MNDSQSQPSGLDASRRSSGLHAEPSAPVRVQLSRAKGWRMPPNTVKVDRTTPYGNPWKIGEVGPGGRIAPDAEGATGLFRQMLRDPEMRAWACYPTDLSPLRGLNLACWCGGPWCHVDPLLEEVNASPVAGTTERQSEPREANQTPLTQSERKP